MDVEAGPHFGSPGDIYNAYPNGIGERPSPDGIPGVRRVIVIGLKTQQGFLRAIRKGGPVRELINELQDKGKSVGLRWAANEVTVFVAEHRKVIIGTVGAAAAIAGVVGAIHFARRSPKKK